MTKQRKGNKAATPKAATPHFFMKRISEGSFILVLTVALFVLLSLLTYRMNDPGWMHIADSSEIANAGGQVGAYIADALYLSFGYLAYLLPVCFAYVAWMILKDHRALRTVNKAMLLLRGVGLVFLLCGGCGLFSLELHAASHGIAHLPGGYLGYYVAFFLSKGLNVQGATLLQFAMLLVGVTWLTGLSWVYVTEFIGCYTLVIIRWLTHGVVSSSRLFLSAVALLKKFHLQKRSEKIKVSTMPIIKADKVNVDKVNKETPTIRKPLIREQPVLIKKANEQRLASKPEVSGTMPSLSLLNKGEPGKPMAGYSHQELELLSREVEQHLLDFGIQADVVAVHPGPVITRFELQLAAGIKVSKLTALSKDLARSLSVTSVRVVEIIPGKTVVGIELPNQNRATVCLSEVLSSDVYQKAHSPLTLALGVDIAGSPMIVDLAKMPHLLVAGTTGSGKSVGINAMILSLLFKSSPEQVRLIMVDPKMLELSVYDGIPHLLTPVVTDMKEAASALRWCVGEMERRYRLMAFFGVRNLSGFNAKLAEAAARGEPLADPLWKPANSMEEQAPELQPLPYIVVIIDELADMMMVVGKKVEQLIARIAQKARAAGIHLILATQRPSVDVLTGLIKSNIPTRISFQVSSKIDSRTILDQQGAEQLLGHGDMLFLAPGTGAPLRVHGAFVDDMEVHCVANDWRARGTPDYIEEITQHTGDGLEGNWGEEGEETEDSDPLYDQAVEFVIQTRKASISAVQRRFKIGYNRAARLVEEMERAGLVGPLEGGFRDVLVAQLED
ncbi:DNA translocase FtsK [Legionella oakridgensis]|uniref:DNA translocase FtsK n=2 Tax=Legionella oakridgensis TaxID=29423 RepID=W0BAX1_9GAMM|nr:DNA translocase FtsK [Legionella oakridgensis]AHE67693.1 DNA segregation ATPase FtsK/SpoIIIE-related protein [Legionella oakridgensis ATCC 33761 = DSM 21215]ETO92734.1 DNA translocase FtsK [Legionella oakridgensis RV-2-2007]KTD36973.1 cell division protein FtsK [Legionella oakridgensis]STY20718.1 cell division protein FtsK [Legionella longbeachae]